MPEGAQAPSSEEPRDYDTDAAHGAAYWREQHARQLYAKNHTYEQFEPAYRTAYDSFWKNRGKKLEELEDEIALGYRKARPGDPLPWDTVRPAVNEVWERMTGVISPREPGRGVRDWI
jgi:hypothetical protein